MGSCTSSQKFVNCENTTNWLHNDRPIWLTEEETITRINGIITEEKVRYSEYEHIYHCGPFENHYQPKYTIDPYKGIFKLELIDLHSYLNRKFRTYTFPYVHYSVPCKHTTRVIPHGIRIPRHDLRSLKIIKRWSEYGECIMNSLIVNLRDKNIAAIVLEYSDMNI